MLRRRQQRTSESQQLRAQLGVAVATAAHENDSSCKRKADATKGRDSNGSSGVDDAEGDAVAAVKRWPHAASMHGIAQVTERMLFEHHFQR